MVIEIRLDERISNDWAFGSYLTMSNDEKGARQRGQKIVNFSFELGSSHRPQTDVVIWDPLVEYVESPWLLKIGVN